MPTNVDGRLFSGESEMAALMRNAEWSATAVGDPDTWPQALRTTVRILLTSRFAMWMGWGPEVTFFYNDAYRTMSLGAKHPWALGRPVREVWAEIWPAIGPRIEKVMRTGTATWDERLLLFLERSGFVEETYHTFSYSPIADDAGTTAGMLCVVTEETERVIGERRLARLHDLASRLSSAVTFDEVLKATTHSLAEEVRDLPFTLTFEFVNEGSHARLATMTGIAPGHAAAADTSEEGDHAVWPLLRERLFAPIVVALPSHLEWPCGAWQAQPSHAVVVPIQQQGYAQPVGAFVAGLNPYRPFDDAYRNFVGLVVGQIAAALASARAYEDERQRASQLAELDRAKTAFFSNVSHEFRTPLTLMLGPTEDALASSQPLAGAELEAVHRNMLRLMKLVNTLLDFSRIEAGRVRASFQRSDLAALTADLASAFRSAVDRAGLQYVVTCEPVAEPTYVDHEMWEKIVLNLLSNAFKFTFEGAIGVTLRSPAPGRVELAVSDTGVGIPDEHLPRIFDRFHRVEGMVARSYEGSGIGLALVQDLVRLHGGQISVTTEVGRGTTFTVSIPTGRAHLRADQVASEEPGQFDGRAAAPYVQEARRWLPDGDAGAVEDAVAGAARGTVAAARVLVADDNADMREYLARLLRTHWDVETVANGEQALAAVRERRPDLILTDVMMPLVDGFGLLRELRSDPGTRSIPIIMLSARAGEDSRIEGIQAGADDYLIKPFSARELLAKVTARLELQRLGRRLAEEREAVAHLFEQAPLPVAIVRGDDLVFEFANEQFMALTGGRRLVGKSLRKGMPEIGGQGFDDRLREVMRTGAAYVGRNELVRLQRNRRLEDTYWTFILAPIRGEDGTSNAVVAICSEVTEQVEARRRLEALAEEASRANRAKDEFLAMLGHELRNPLAPMLTALQLMRLRGGGALEKERTVIERQARHLVRLVDDLLDVSRIARGKVELKKELVEVGEVVAKAIEMASPLLELREHDLTVDVPAHGLVVDADPARLAQVIGNLLTNAGKYTEKGGHITVTARLDGAEVRVSVKDTGIGISPAMLPYVFDMFAQERQALDRSQGGLGLGLTIVRSLTERHGGTVEARSDGPGRGSEFVLRIPNAVDATARRTTAVPSGAPQGRHVARRQILVVDDNEDAAMTLADFLAGLGHSLRVAHDGPSALRILSEFTPDLALIDIGLPVMDGYELAGHLRSHPSLGRLKLIAVTGYGQPSDRALTVAAGFDGHLVKPVDLELLERFVRTAADASSE
ncbi:MAG TPA: ATP-binding protein [Vicinamibacterales bacterium]|nr:ATP-binding protein [Vicinamibacterales bacterium]